MFSYNLTSKQRSIIDDALSAHYKNPKTYLIDTSVFSYCRSCGTFIPGENSYNFSERKQSLFGYLATFCLIAYVLLALFVLSNILLNGIDESMFIPSLLMYAGVPFIIILFRIDNALSLRKEPLYKQYKKEIRYISSTFGLSEYVIIRYIKLKRGELKADATMPTFDRVMFANIDGLLGLPPESDLECFTVPYTNFYKLCNFGREEVFAKCNQVNDFKAMYGILELHCLCFPTN